MNMKIREITKNEIINNYKDYLTVENLKQFIEKNNIPNTAKVLIQRVEDKYFEHNNWGVYYKEGFLTSYDENGNVIKESLEQYHPAFGCVKYNDDKDLLFIDLHY